MSLHVQTVIGDTFRAAFDAIRGKPKKSPFQKLQEQLRKTIASDRPREFIRIVSDNEGVFDSQRLEYEVSHALDHAMSQQGGSKLITAARIVMQLSENRMLGLVKTDTMIALSIFMTSEKTSHAEGRAFTELKRTIEAAPESPAKLRLVKIVARNSVQPSASETAGLAYN